LNICSESEPQPGSCGLSIVAKRQKATTVFKNWEITIFVRGCLGNPAEIWVF